MIEVLLYLLVSFLVQDDTSLIVLEMEDTTMNQYLKIAIIAGVMIFVLYLYPFVQRNLYSMNRNDSKAIAIYHYYHIIFTFTSCYSTLAFTDFIMKYLLKLWNISYKGTTVWCKFDVPYRGLKTLSTPHTSLYYLIIQL